MERNASPPRAVKRDFHEPEHPRAEWEPPKLEELSPLTDLTLQTGGPIGGGGDTGGGGSSVF